jgi:hypothetical protein
MPYALGPGCWHVDSVWLKGRSWAARRDVTAVF